ncbi:MAG: [FeFe] hydrogenase H-cluster radical SAM maturase HydE [Defluviitaleaceae bacterium]|nr:[FeFe] hydrogenase H-cluster radical SAM maturase HydE [Defluviitaleaceae bacterium]
MNELVEKLREEKILSREEFKILLAEGGEELHKAAREVCESVFGTDVYIRGLIEFTNYCGRNCNYCGIRSGNAKLERYRLSVGEILACCAKGYELGIRTFVLQGGEDDFYSDERLVEAIVRIKTNHPDCAITLSVGERSRESYKRLFDAGADRYLLRHETASDELYARLHPADLSLASRKKCLLDLKEIGYQVGCGFMVGSPGQTLGHIADDFLFIRELDPHMVGIGPFMPHADTVYADEPPGDLNLVLNALAILRLMNPNVLLPSTTALGTLSKKGRELGILAGANVVMPNLTPAVFRKKYMLYDNKIGTSDDAVKTKTKIAEQMQNVGRKIVVKRGDFGDV